MVLSLLILFYSFTQLNGKCAWIEPFCAGFTYCPKVPSGSCYTIYEYLKALPGDIDSDNADLYIDSDSEKYTCDNSNVPKFYGYTNNNCDSSNYVSYRGKVAPISWDCNGSGDDCPFAQYKSGKNGYRTHIIIIDLCLNHTKTVIDDIGIRMKLYNSYDNDCSGSIISSRIIANASDGTIVSTSHKDNNSSYNGSSNGSSNVWIYAIIAVVIVILTIAYVYYKRKTLKAAQTVQNNDAINVKTTEIIKETKGARFEYNNVAASAPVIGKYDETDGGQFEYNDMKACVPVNEDDELPKYEQVKNDTENGEECMEGLKDKHLIVKQWFEKSVDGIDDEDKLLYFDRFVENGFDNLIGIKEMTMDDLKEIGIDLLGHRKTIFYAIRQLQ
eukprot:280542_1